MFVLVTGGSALYGPRLNGPFDLPASDLAFEVLRMCCDNPDYRFTVLSVEDGHRFSQWCLEREQKTREKNPGTSITNFADTLLQNQPLG